MKYLLLPLLLTALTGYSQYFTIHTEDVDLFWKIYDKNAPKLKARSFQQEYIDAGSIGLKKFVPNRIVNGKNLARVVRKNHSYYKAIRETTLSHASRNERFRECFENLKSIYPNAVFPDIYFVIGAKNTGGTAFKEGLIIGAEMFGNKTGKIKPRLDIDLLDEVVVHELIHYQQQYIKDNSLLAQSIREGSADFLCELIVGNHSNKSIHEYGNHNEKELWNEFSKRMYNNDWRNWLYYQKDRSRPKDLGYWMGYKITKSYYDNAADKKAAIYEILNIQDFKNFLQQSEYKP